MLYEYIKTFECPRCHSRQTFSHGLQTRDVNNTTTVFCVECEFNGITITMDLIQLKKVIAEKQGDKVIILTTTVL